jgi:hypothetical protein
LFSHSVLDQQFQGVKNPFSASRQGPSALNVSFGQQPCLQCLDEFTTISSWRAEDDAGRTWIRSSMDKARESTFLIRVTPFEQSRDVSIFRTCRARIGVGYGHERGSSDPNFN